MAKQLDGEQIQIALKILDKLIYYVMRYVS